MTEPHERTTLESLEAAVTDEFGEEGEVKDAILLVAGALVEVAKTLQWFRDEMGRDRQQRDQEEKEWRDQEAKEPTDDQRD